MKNKGFRSTKISGKLLASYLEVFLANPTKQTLSVFAMSYLPHRCVLDSLTKFNKAKMARAWSLPCGLCPLFVDLMEKDTLCPRDNLLKQWNKNPGTVVLKLTQLKALQIILSMPIKG